MDNSNDTYSNDNSSNWGSNNNSYGDNGFNNPWDTQNNNDGYGQNNNQLETQENNNWLDRNTSQDDSEVSFASQQEEERRNEIEKSKLQNINNLNGLKSGLNTMDESTPITGSNEQKQNINNKNQINNDDDVMNLFRPPRQRAKMDIGVAAGIAAATAANLNSPRDTVSGRQTSARSFTPNNSDVSHDDHLRELFKSHGPVDEDNVGKVNKSKVIKHPFLKAKSRIKKFINVSIIALGTLIIGHHLTTPNLDTKDMSPTQIAAELEQEKVLSAGIGDFELMGLKAVRYIDNKLEEKYEKIFNDSYPTQFNLLKPSTLKAINQATLNKMLKDYPAYPEATNGFMLESPINKDVRVSIMKNLIKTNHFNKNSHLQLELENIMFEDAIQKSRDIPVNQVTSYPFKYADQGLVGTKVITNPNTFKASGKISDALPESLSILKGVVGVADFATVSISDAYHFVTAPAIKFSGLFSNNDLSAYTKDPAKISPKGFSELTNPNAPVLGYLPSPNYGPETNKKLAELHNKAINEVDGGPSLKEMFAIAVAAHAHNVEKDLKDVQKKNQTLGRTAPLNTVVESGKAQAAADRKAVLERVKSIVQPDPNTSEKDKQAGLKIIEEIKKNKP